MNRITHKMMSMAAAALLLASCAAPLRMRGEADPLAILDPGLAVYARLDGALARRLLSASLDEKDADSIEPLLEKTSLAALGIGRPEAAEAAGRPLLEAALVGNYPFRRASLGLAASGEWKREGAAYLHGKSGIRAVVPGPELVLASTGPIEGLLARAREPGASPIPARLADLARTELVVWIPAPFALPALGDIDIASLPARGVLVAASPDASGSYVATLAFLMSDADAARVYRPAIRIAWYFLAPTLLGAEAGTAASARFELDGDLVYASGLVLPEAAIARAVALALQKAGLGPGDR